MLKLNRKDEYVTFKLITGEDILGKVVETSMTTYTINKPRVLVVTADQNGQQNAALLPYMQLTKSDDIEFNTSAIIAMAPMSDEVKPDYLRLVSGIHMATHMPTQPAQKA